MAKKIVIVEDSSVIFKITKILQMAGYEVLVIQPNQGQKLCEVLDAMSNFKPDLVLLDHELGYGVAFDGNEVKKSLVRFPEEKIVSISGDYRSYCKHNWNNKKFIGEDDFKNDFLSIIQKILG